MPRAYRVQVGVNGNRNGNGVTRTAPKTPAALYANVAPVYADKGWPQVIPLGQRDKSPLVRGHHGGSAVALDEVSRAALAQEYPNANIGIVLPPGILGIDVDGYGSKPGAATWATMRDLFGPFPATWRSSAREAPSGIYVFTVPLDLPLGHVERWLNDRFGVDVPDAKSGRVRRASGIDVIRADHRYVVAAPSVHATAGPDGAPARYRWHTPDGEPVRNTAGWPQPQVIPAAPAAFVDAIRAALAGQDPEWIAGACGRSGAPLAIPAGAELAAQPAVLARVEHLRDELAGTPDGLGAQACNDTAVKVGNYVGAGQIDYDLARSVLYEALEDWTFARSGDRRRCEDQIDGGLKFGMRRTDRPWVAAASGLWQDDDSIGDVDDMDAPVTVTVEQGAPLAVVRKLVNPNKDAKGDPKATGAAQPKAAKASKAGVAPAAFDTGALDPATGKIRLNLSQDGGDATARYLRANLGSGPTSLIFYSQDRPVRCPRIGEHGYIPLPPVIKQPGGVEGVEGVVHVHHSAAQVRTATESGIRVMIEEAYSVGRPKWQEINSAWEWNTSLMTPAVMASVMGGFDNGISEGDGGGGQMGGLGHLRGVVHTPVLLGDGTVLTAPGLHRPSGLVFMPLSQAEESYEITDFPTAEQVDAARATLLFPFSEYPFVTDADYGNMIGSMLMPWLREVLPTGSTRLFVLIDAPMPGAGKTGLLKTLIAVHDGEVVADMPHGDPDEMRKVLAALLLTTTGGVIGFDNLTGVIRSAPLEAMITSNRMRYRRLGKNDESHELINNRLIVGTSNNAKVGGDLGRRTLRVTINPNTPQPWGRTFDFEPEAWLRENRMEYITAGLTLIRAWVAAGRPLGTSDRSDTFDAPIATVRGIFAVCGIDLPYAQPRVNEAGAVIEQSDDDDTLGALLDSLRNARGVGTENCFTSGDIISDVLARAVPSDLLPSKTVDQLDGGRALAASKSLGMWLAHRIGRFADGLCLRHTRPIKGVNRNKNVYWVEESAVAPPREGEDAPGEVPDIPDGGEARRLHAVSSGKSGSTWV